MSKFVRAPWTPRTVEALNDYQRSGQFHEYTCVNRHTLVATRGGWLCPKPDCGYTQDWAHWSHTKPPVCIGCGEYVEYCCC